MTTLLHTRCSAIRTALVLGVSLPILSSCMVENSAPTISNVKITDSNGALAHVGEVLEASYTYHDSENDLEGNSVMHWLRDNTVISGAVDTTYTLVDADAGAVISFEVIPVAKTGTLMGIGADSNSISVEQIALNEAPTATNLSITDQNGGSAQIGDILSAEYTYQDSENDVEGQSSFQWLRDSAIIDGATSLTYTLTNEDSGSAIAFEITPIAATGTLEGSAVTSSVINVDVSADNTPPVATEVMITDSNGETARVGDTLNASYTYSDLDNDAEGDSPIRWLRNDVTIPGATTLNYTLTEADIGTDIRFEVTPVASSGVIIGFTETSNAINVATENVAPSASSVTLIDTNGGVALVNDLLTADYTFNDDDGDLEGTSTFRWLRDASVIVGATTLNYTLTDSDIGSAIRFEVTPTAASGILIGTPVLSDVINVPDIPNEPPVTVISFPPEKSMTSGNSIVVRGSASDASGIESVFVNGVEATSEDDYATWTATVSGLEPGFTTLTATTTDYQSDTSSQAVEIRSAPLADEIYHLTYDHTYSRFFAIESNQLISVNRTNGLTSRLDSTDAINRFDSVADMQFDSANNRMIVLDNQDDLSTIKEVNLTTGERTIVSQDLLPEPDGTLSRLVYDMALDSSNDILYIADGLKGIIELDLITGERTLLSTTKGKGIVFDAPNDRLFTTTSSSVIAIDTATGASTTIANNSIASATSNISLSSLYGITHDTTNNRLFVSSHNSDLIIEVDLDDGTRTLISDNDSYGGDVDFNLPLYMEYDSVNDRVLVTDSYLIAVDVNTGTRTKLGTSYGELDGIGFNSATNQVYAVRRARGLQKFDIPNDTNETISDNTIATATSDTEFGDIWGLEMNFDDGLAYISDWSANSIIEVDLATGARTTLADNSKPDANNTFISPVEFSWDATNDRMFVLDSGRGSIIEVDYNSGVRTVISSATVPNRVNAFRTPSDIALDLPNNRAFVLDTGYGAVIEVALDTGARTIIGTLSGTFAKQYYAFDFDSVNDRLLLVNRYDGLVEMDLSGNTNTIVDKDFRDVIFDATSEQAFVLESDTFAGRVLEIVDVDLTTGETEHVPTSVTPDKNVSLDNPFDIEIDPSNNRAFVSDLDKAAIIALDLDTGARTVLSDNTIAVGTSTMSFTLPKGITLDSQNNRLLVLDSTQDALIAVALDTGARTLISDNLTAVDTSTFDFSSPRYLVLDEANNRALVLDGSTLVAVNLSNGERTILTDNSMEGIQLSGQSDLTIDVANNRALISDLNRDTVIAVDLDNGARSIFVDDDTPVVGSDGFSKPLGITIDPLNNRIILVDWWSRTVNAADLDTAVRTRLSSSSGANSFFTFQTSSVVYDEEHDRALVVDIDRDTITAVDLVTGARVILSQ